MTYSPRMFIDINSVIKEACKQVPVIAGGAPRDFLLGRPIKDYDTFVYSHSNIDFRLIEEALIPYWGKPVSAYHEERTYRTWHQTLTGVTTFANDVQVCGVDYTVDMENVVATFDLGIGQVAWCENEWYRHANFVSDVRDKKITLLPLVPNLVSPIGGFTRTLNRLHRIKSKYPTWEVRVHPDFHIEGAKLKEVAPWL